MWLGNERGRGGATTTVQVNGHIATGRQVKHLRGVDATGETGRNANAAVQLCLSHHWSTHQVTVVDTVALEVASHKVGSGR